MLFLYSAILTCSISWGVKTPCCMDQMNKIKWMNEWIYIYIYIYIWMCLSSLLKYIVWNHPPHFNIALVGKSVSTYVVSTNISSRGSVCDITLGDDSIQIKLALFMPWIECIVAHIRNFGTRQKEAVNFMSHCLSPREPAEAVWALWTNAKCHSSARNQTRIPEVMKPMAKLLYQLSCPGPSPIYMISTYVILMLHASICIKNLSMQ